MFPINTVDAFVANMGGSVHVIAQGGEYQNIYNFLANKNMGTLVLMDCDGVTESSLFDSFRIALSSNYQLSKSGAKYTSLSSAELRLEASESVKAKCFFPAGSSGASTVDYLETWRFCLFRKKSTNLLHSAFLNRTDNELFESVRQLNKPLIGAKCTCQYYEKGVRMYRQYYADLARDETMVPSEQICEELCGMFGVRILIFHELDNGEIEELPYRSVDDEDIDRRYITIILVLKGSRFVAAVDPEELKNGGSSAGLRPIFKDFLRRI